jgi:hypothetical protein
MEGAEMLRKISLLLTAVAICALAISAGAEPRRDVEIRTGGVGLDERAAFDAERGRYNLRVAFVENDGDYVASVAVRLSSPDDRTVYYEGRTEGPFLFAGLEPGPYRLEARYEGLVQVRALNVGADQPQPYLYLRWPQGEARAGTDG